MLTISSFNVGILEVMVGNPVLMFNWNCGRWKRRRRAWNVAPLTVMWVIWRETNRRAFEDIEMNFIRLTNSLFILHFFLVQLWDPFVGVVCIEPYHFVGFLLFWYTSCIRAFFVPKVLIKLLLYQQKKNTDSGHEWSRKTKINSLSYRNHQKFLKTPHKLSNDPSKKLYTNASHVNCKSAYG